MNITELEPIVRDLQSIAADAASKRKAFREKGRQDMLDVVMGEAVGVGKCLRALEARYPDLMATITAVTE